MKTVFTSLWLNIGDDLIFVFSCRNAAHGFSLIQVDNTKVTMKEILLKAVKRRKGSQKIPGPQYRLEKQSEPNIAVDLESTLESQSAWEFCLVRENSTLASSLHVRFVRCNMLTSPLSGNAQWSGLPRQI